MALGRAGVVAAFPVSRTPLEEWESSGQSLHVGMAAAEIHLSTALRMLGAPASLHWERGAESSTDPGVLSSGS